MLNIGKYAFSCCRGLTNVTIPGSVISIGEGAFYNCSGLTSVTIPDSVTSIGGSAFTSCTGLTSITIPNSVKSIDYDAFLGVTNVEYHGRASGSPWGAKIANGYIESNLVYKNSSKSVLVGCSTAATGDITIPSSVETIRDRAFYNCVNLNKIIIPSDSCISSIGANAFYNVNNIVYSENWYTDVMYGQGSPWGAKAVDAYAEGDLYYYDSSKELLLGCSPEATGTVTIPSSVEEVGENCFSGCDRITTLSFSSPVIFADTALAGCESLETVDTAYNKDAFGVVYTKPVESASAAPVPDGEITVSSIDSEALSIEYDTGILFCNRDASGTYSVPSYVTYICEKAFANCGDVFVDMNGNDNIKSIGANAFLESGDYKTESNWVNGVLTLGNYAVAAKNTIRGGYTLPSGIKGIADRCFSGCSSLTGFSFENANVLKFLGSRLFGGCSDTLKNSITLSNVPETLTYIGEDLFDSQSETGSEKETKYIGKVLVSVDPDVTSFEITAGTTNIADGAFSGCTKLQSITIPDSIKIIGKNTFKSCTSLSSVTLNNNVTEIGTNAFADCISLNSIYVPASVNEIGPLAFYGCTELTGFDVADGNTSYQDIDGVLWTKDGCTLIQYPAAKNGTEYSIPEETYVSDLALYRCKKLEVIKIGEDVEYGNRNPFAACTAGFSFGDGTESVYLFGDTDGTLLKSVSASVTGTFTIPETVTEIGSDALRECTGITEIDFSEAYDLEIIRDYAFYGCTGLTSIIIPESVIKIGNSAFENCTNLKRVYFTGYGGSITKDNKILLSIGDYAFCGCPCNTSDDGCFCNKNILRKEDLTIGRNAFNNDFSDSVCSDDKGLVYSLENEMTGISKYVDVDNHITVTCTTDRVGTGSVITLTGNGGHEVSYEAVVFGDVNGDGWYDGTDAMIVNCIANGILTEEQAGSAVYTAADCNHDGEIDSADVAILEQAGVLLASVDQSKTEAELQTDSAYQEYLSLIDQTPGVEETEQADETSEPDPVSEPAAQISLFKILTDFITRLFTYLKLHFSIIK